MKFFISTIALSFFLNSQIIYAQHSQKKSLNDPVGEGLLHVDKMQNVQLYKSEDISKAFDTIRIVRVNEGKKKGSFEFQSNTLKDSLDPFRMTGGSSEEEGKELVNSGLGPGSPALAFRVIRHNDSLYEVVISEKGNITAVVKRDKNLVFESWEHYLMRLAAIDGLNDDISRIIFDKPGGKRVKVNTPYAIQIVEVRGFWVQVAIKTTVLGWVKWRDDNKLLIIPIEQILE